MRGTRRKKRNRPDGAGHRSRRETTDLSQLRARERRSLTSRLGEAYQRWNETEGQREAKLHQQRKRVAKQAKLQEEASAVTKALVEALKLAEQAVVVVRRPPRAPRPLIERGP